MSEKRVREILLETEAFLEGHFLLSSGRHSCQYVQCAKLLRFPDKAAEVLKDVADQIKDLGITKICGPAMGGVIVSYELGRQLGIESIFTERKDGNMELRRGFEVGKSDRIIISEDVVTTGKSTLETVKVLEDMGAEVVGVCSIVNRMSPDLDFPLPVYSAIKLDIVSYDKDECPMCREGKIELVKPGSRDFKKE